MKKITAEVSNETFEYLQTYAQQLGKSVEEMTAEVLENCLSMLDFDRQVQDMKHRHEQWRRERGFSSHGQAKTVPYSIRR